MTEVDEEDFENNNICRFCERGNVSDKVRYHCHLTSKYRGPAHNTCNRNVTQKQSNFIPFVFHIFSNYDCHLIFKKLVDKKNDEVKFKIIPKTDEEDIIVSYGCIRFIASHRFSSISSDKLVKTLVDKSHKTLQNLKNKIVDNDYDILKIVKEIGEEDRTIEKFEKRLSR